MQFRRNSVILLLLGILLLGLGLRLYCLTKEDIWYDEAVTIKAAEMPLPEMIHFTLRPSHDTSFPPVYYILMKGWVDMFGDSPAAVRMVSVLCGTFTILAIYGIGRILFNEKYGLYLGLLMALSPFDIYYSQETRGYALQILLICIAIYFFVRALKKDSRGFWWCYAITLLGAIYLHLFSSFVWISLFAFHIIYLAEKKLTFSVIVKRLFAQWAIMVGMAPLFIVKIMYYSSDLINWVEPFKLSFYRQTLVHLIFGVQKAYTHGMYVLGMSIITICLIVSLYNLVVTRFRNKSSTTEFPNVYSTGLLAWILFLGPVLIFTVVSLTIHQIYVPWRYLIIVLPGFLLLMTHSLSLMSHRTVRILIMIVLPALFFISDLRNPAVPAKVGMKSVAEYLQKNSQSSDYIFFLPGYHQESFLYYNKEQIHTGDGNNWNNSLKNAILINSRTWLVLDRGSVSEKEADKMLNYLISVYERPVQKEILPPYQVELYLFEKKS